VGLKAALHKIDLNPQEDIYDKAFLYLLAASVVLRVLWLDKPVGSLIFDEKYYVNVARNILRLPHEPDVYPDATPGLDPNHEHPFLGKGLIALSMMFLGDNAWGWRIPSVIFGTVGVLVFYLLVKKLARRSDFALFAAFLFTFDNLVFVHGRVATLDIFMLTFMLLGVYWYFSGRTYISALALALSTLSKIGGLYGFATVIVFPLAKTLLKKGGGGGVQWRPSLDWLEKYALTYVISGLVLLTVFDRLWVGFNNPFDHISFIYSYTKALTRLVPEGIESYPWQWLINEVKIPYLTVNVNVYSNDVMTKTYPSVAFTGAMNPLIIFLTIPAILYSAYSYYEKREDLTLFTVIWFALTYLPFYPMSILWHRIMYIFYFLSTIPSVCIAITYLFLDQRPHRIIILAYVIAVLVGFGLLFPFKTVP